MPLHYTDALPEQCEWLTQTATTAKKNWGYPDAWMELWKEELEVSEQYILENRVVLVYERDAFIGFFGLKKDGQDIEIDHLWLLPASQRKGYGRIIFRHILDLLGKEGHTAATLIAEPYAKGFYDKMGGKVVGQMSSQKINGRILEQYRFDF